ncbi:MAG: hypothetical protein LUQ31_06115 [Methanoregula sp.]|nr:hypothetical protein [Methanoregula sp.]
MTSGKRIDSRTYISVILVLLLIVALCSAGCINMIRKSASGEPAATPAVPVGLTENPVATQSVPQTLQPTKQQTAVSVTPLKSEIVIEVTPYTTPDPYPIIPGVRINSTPQYSFLDRTPEFTKTYTLGGNATGLLVNVVQGPLYIVYTIDPKYDCLMDPDSCRGTVLVPVNRPYMTITVRDNQTREIVAQNGYGREYSSDTGNYGEITYMGAKVDSTDNSGESVATPGPRYIAIYREGQFQITLQGNYLDVNIRIITGASPNRQDAAEKSSSSGPVPTPEYQEE